jgi:hypothetical protein
MNFKWVFMNCLKFTLLVLILTSCKNPFKKTSSSVGGGGGGVPSSQQMNDYLSSKLSSEIPRCSSVTLDDVIANKRNPIVFPSGSRQFKPEWAESVSLQFEKPYMEGLRNTQIKESDLEQIGCPGFNNATEEQKRKFWVVFMSAIAKPEDNFRTDGCYHEDDGTDSCGLLQIDYAAANRWCGLLAAEMGKTSFTTEDMKVPEVNMKCGLMIMDAQLNGSAALSLSKQKPPTVIRNKPGRPNIKGSLFVDNGPFYWNVLRNNDEKEEVIEWFKKHAERQLPFCKTPNVDVELGNETFILDYKTKLTSRAEIGKCKFLTGNNRIRCEKRTIDKTEKDVLDTESFPKGADLNLGEQKPTTEESCDIVDNTGRNVVPSKALHEGEKGDGNQGAISK